MRSIRFGLLIFQSTLPRRERQSSGINAISKSPISIHTPTKGATLPVIKYAGCETISIHTPTKGATHTHHCFFARWINFNPHSHEGSDRKFYFVFMVLCISIHTPTKGATEERAKETSGSQISIHTPTKGATGLQHDIITVTRISIHTPTKGATSSLIIYISIITNFNPHSHEGSDLCIYTLLHFLSYFNPHSHEGSDFQDHLLSDNTFLFQSTLPRRERHTADFLQ